ncbi:MAG TPA: SDR family NAD(P)-dependent oxidoreductase [Terriglobia bacterium]|nr:SDR family NAD(P)-dependent oxidoreductase [Terriglobia bacterium]
MTSARTGSIEWASRKVLVTGAGGFIGSHLTDRLLSEGASVRAFIRYNSRNDLGFLADVKNERLEIIKGDIRDLETVRKAATGVNVIFHLAALVGIPYSYQHVSEVVEVNTLGTLNALMAARENQVDRIVHTSTSEVYGTALTPKIAESHPRQAQSPYSASKIAADALALSFYHSFGLPVAVCRPFNTFGPRQSDRAIIPALMSQALSKDEIVVGNLTPTRDFTFVTDTVDGFLHIAASDDCVGKEINLGTGHEVSVGDLTRKIVALVGRNSPIRQSEERKRSATSEVQRLCSDNSLALSLAGWKPRVSLEKGLELTLEWVKNQSHLYNPDQYRV